MLYLRLLMTMRMSGTHLVHVSVLQPGGAIIIVQTRWSKKDLTGRLLNEQAKDTMSDQWDVIEFPALLPSGNPLWPEFWDKNELTGGKSIVIPD
jgi:hypothetical protein